MQKWLYTMLTASILVISTHSLAQSSVLRDGVIVDTDNATVFLMQPNGGILAVNTTSGDTVWSTAAADKPLLIANGELITQAQNSRSGEISLRFLAPDSGIPLSQLAVNINDNVSATIADGLGQSFSIIAPDQNPNNLHWRFSSTRAQGAAPNFNELLSNNSVSNNQFSTNGVIRLNMSNRTVTESLQDVPAQTLTNTTTNQLRTVNGRQFLSADGQHILVSEVNQLEDLQARYQWTIFTNSGDRLGSFSTTSSYTGFVVIDNHVVFSTPVLRQRINDQLVEIPLSIRAVNLESGQEVWRRTLRDLRYSGPLPI